MCVSLNIESYAPSTKVLKTLNEVLACRKNAVSWSIFLLEELLAENRVLVTVETLIRGQMDFPFCNRYTQTLGGRPKVCYINHGCFCFFPGNAVSRYPPVTVGVLNHCAVTHV